MKLAKPSRKLSRHSHRKVIDELEQRIMLSATVVSQVPHQTLQPGQSAGTISLGTYFDDSAVAAGDTVVNLQTNLPAPDNSIPLELTTAATPHTVANFLSYITSGEYANNVISRAISGFIVQGGGYKTDGTPINVLGSLVGESSTATFLNTTGTIAMALSSGPNTGTDQWFINLANNPELDNTSDGGPFTAFGKVLYNGLNVLNYICTLPLEDDAGVSAWDAAQIGEAPSLPVLGGTNGATVSTVPTNDLVTTTAVEVPGGLTYTVSSSNTAAVTASVSGASLSVNPVAAGTSTVTVTATDLSGGTASSTFTVTVAAPVIPTVSIANASGTAGTNSQIVFPVTLSAVSTSATTLSYAVTAGTAPASDFTATASSLTIPAGATTASIPVTLVKDSANAAETFTISLSGLSTNAIFSTGAAFESATGTINPAVVLNNGPFSTTTTLAASSTVVPLNGPETFTATVVSPGTGTGPAGDVTFDEGGTSIGSAAISNGVATFATDLSSPGNQVITAVYAGDSTHLASTSSAITVNVAALAPVVSKNTVPASVIGGTSVKGTAVVALTNNTSATEKGTVTIGIYASVDGLIDSNSTLVKSVKPKLSIGEGKTASVAVPVTSLPSTLSTGVYTLLTQTIDTSGNISDSVTGPTITIIAPVVSLTPSFLRLTLPTSVVSGSKTSAVALLKISNGGNVATSGLSTINLYASPDDTVADGTLIKTLAIKKLSIKAGKSESVSVPLGKYPSGLDSSYFIIAQVIDPKGNATQVRYGSPVTIAAPEIDLADGVVSVPGGAVIGKSVAVTLNVANNGNITAAGLLDIAFSVSASSTGFNPVSIGNQTVRISIKPDGQIRLHVKRTIPLGISAGDYFLVATVDPGDVFADSNLANNTSISTTAITFTG